MTTTLKNLRLGTRYSLRTEAHDDHGGHEMVIVSEYAVASILSEINYQEEE